MAMMPHVRPLHYRFGIVLGLILITLGFQLAAPEGDGARLVIVILQAATLVAAVVASRVHRGLIAVSMMAAVIGVAGASAAILGTDQFGNASAALVALLYLVLTPPAIVTGLIKHFRDEGGVTLQTMFGVLCLYLLIGLAFATSFAVIHEISDRDFFTVPVNETDDYLYFSYTTLTTVGYGDLVAATELGRALAICEALIGQIYLVTVVAVIVGNLRPAAPRSPARRAE